MMIPDADGWYFIGKHAIRFEPPDIVFNRPGGDMTLEQNRQIIALVESFPRPEKGFFGLIDAANGGRQDPEAVKDPAILARANLYRGVAHFNAAFHHRTLIGLFQRVARLLKFPVAQVPLESA